MSLIEAAEMIFGQLASDLLDSVVHLIYSSGFRLLCMG
jgi:hypothetical protein